MTSKISIFGQHFIPLHGFPRWPDHFFLGNRAENQNEPKRPQNGGRLGSFWFSTRPTAMEGTDYNLHLVSEAL